jgi:HAD superfamily hydrolase (TIGR01509 family)
MPPAALFDVDGTLVDSNYFHVLAWFEAFRINGHEVSAATLHRCLGMGSDRLVPHVLGRDDEDVRRAHSNFYAPALERLRPFPDARRLLAATAELGLTVVLATSATPPEVERLLAALGGDEAVAHVVDKGDVAASKPSPDLVRAGLSAAGVPPSEAVMIGDSVWDVEAARAAGVGCVGLCCGGFAAEELQAAGAIAVYADPAELLDRLADSPLARLAKERS